MCNTGLVVARGTRSSVALSVRVCVIPCLYVVLVALGFISDVYIFFFVSRICSSCLRGKK